MHKIKDIKINFHPSKFIYFSKKNMNLTLLAKETTIEAKKENNIKIENLKKPKNTIEWSPINIVNLKNYVAEKINTELRSYKN